MTPDIPDWTQAVNVTGGTVNIGGTASVSIVGTPTVVISGTPSVNIANTPSVVISSGSVNIANASIAVINATGTKITSSRPPKQLGVVFDNPNPNTVTLALDPDVQALVFVLPFPLAQYVHLKASWTPQGGFGSVWTPLELFAFDQSVYVVPLLPSARMQNNQTATSIDVLLQGTALGGQLVEVWELFEPNPLWLEFFAPPFAEPNQPPISTNVGMTVIGTNYPIIAPVANVEIWLFMLALLSAQGFATVQGISIGYGPNPGAVTQLMTDDVVTGSPIGPGHILNFGGAPLGRGNGLYINKAGGAGVLAWIDGTVTYSLG